MVTIGAFATPLPPSAATAAAAAAIASAGVALLLWRRRPVAGTTLTAPLWWMAGALAAIAACEVACGLVGAEGSDAWRGPLRFVAAVLTFCPVVAILGAKRPQSRGWQFIVISLWAVLSLPAWRSLALNWSGRLYIDDAQAWFIAVLILVGLVNRLPTRRWPSALLLAGGQISLLAAHLPGIRMTLETWSPLLGLSMISAGVGLASFGTVRSRAASCGIDRAWLDFRDAYGLLWSLRVVDRVNTAARLGGWGASLTWRGAVSHEADGKEKSISPDDYRALEKTIRSVLGRFVSANWLDERLGEPAHPTVEGVAPSSS